MKRTNAPSLARLLAGSLSLAAAAAGATVVNGTFTLSPDFGLALASPVTGRFSYDDSLAPAATGHGDEHRDLISFELRIGATDLALGDLLDAFAVFDGDRFLGLEVTRAGLTLSPSVAGQDPFFAYSNGRQESIGAVRFDLDGTVPEPGTLAAAIGGLAALGTAARRRRVRPR